MATITTETQTQARTVDLMAIARNALAEAGGDATVAERIIVQAAQDDEDVSDRLVAIGAASLVGSLLSSRRLDIVRTVANPDRATRPGDHALAAVERASLKGMHAWYVPHLRKPIADVLPSELDGPIDACAKESTTHAMSAAFMRLVQREAKDAKQRIGRQLTPEQLARLMERAKKAVS